MKRSIWFLGVTLFVLVLGGIWLWWMKPQPADMAAYAPADALLFIESNRPTAVLEALSQTEAWRTFELPLRLPHTATSNRWQGIIAWTGIGPIESVLLARSQVAVVITNLDSTESGETLKVKSEGAILIETHTSESRIKAPFEDLLKSFAEKLYDRPILQRVTADGVDFIEWQAREGSRRIVGTVAGSLLIVGTSEDVVKNCLAAAQGRRPALKADAELTRMRRQVAQDYALAFGYVPAGGSAKLLTFAVPLLMGRAPGDSDFQRFVTTGASKVFGSLAWSSRAYQTGIEDRYLISLQPAVVDRLKPHFSSTNERQLSTSLPEDVYSVTSYRFREPEAAWRSVKLAVASQVDSLSGIVFTTLLKSSLLSYGIGEPESFLATIGGEILTLRLHEGSERSMLLAGVRNHAGLREILRTSMKFSRGEEGYEVFENSEAEIEAVLSQELLVIGAPSDLQSYLALRRAGTGLSAEKRKQLTYFSSGRSLASVITLTNDESRVRNFFETISTNRGTVAPAAVDFENLTSRLPYSVTESSLVDEGLERITRSPLGQFSTLLPLLLPEKSSSPDGSNK